MDSQTLRRASRAIAICLVTVSLALCGVAGRARAQNVSYSYDKLGRLVKVVDSSGNTASYTYDAVGNLFSITTGTSSTVSVTGFSPASGPAGTVVTIQGSNFSATPSQNAVNFNGASAVVTASTSTSITTSVPSLATTGPISVTAPLGSGISSGAFGVP